MPQKSAFEERLGEAMRDAGLNQRQVAEELGVNPSYISNLLSAKRSPSFRTLVVLSNVLGVSRAWLESGRGPKRGVPRILPRAHLGPELDSWTAALVPLLEGGPLEGALGDLTSDPVDATQRAWRSLDDDRRRAVYDVLRGMASVAVVIDRSLPKKVAEALNDELAKQVRAYLADAF